MVSILGKLVVGGTPTDCQIINLSLGGALIAATQRRAMGERCQITFFLPTIDDAIDVGATVRWGDDKSVGIQFDGLRARDVWALNEFFKTLPGE